MELAESLRKLVAEFFEADLEQVDGSFELSGPKMESSLARARLDAVIRRRIGVRCAAVYSVKTFAELEAAILGKPLAESSHVSSSPIRQAASNLFKQEALVGGEGLSCGIDLETVADLPQANDYWEEDFYRLFFTPAEIAYCLTQENPRVHFAARWCVKEALKKCDPAYLNEHMSTIEVSMGATGNPFLIHHVNGNATRLPHAVSISHTSALAIAIVIGSGPQQAKAVPHVSGNTAGLPDHTAPSQSETKTTCPDVSS